MSKLLVNEPPLIVLRSLAQRFGLNEAIVLQQMHFLGRLADDGWVKKTAAELVTSFPFWSEATIKRALKDLRTTGLLEGRQVPISGGGRAYEHRVAYAQLDPAPAQLSTAPAQSEPASTNSVKENQEKDKTPNPPRGRRRILSTAEEPEGFAQWLGQHVAICAKWGIERQVPRAETDARSELARTFAALREQGYSLEDFEMASEGVLADEFMRQGGHTKPENVLRKSKIAGRIDDGWRAREAEAGRAEESARRSQYDGLVAN